MRVDVVETSAQGGLLHYAAQLADSLAERGVDTTLVVPRGNELSGRAGPARRLEILTAPAPPTSRPPSGRVAVFLRRARIAVRLMRCWAEVAARIRRGGADVVILNPDMTLAPVALVGVALTALPGGPRLAKVAHNVRTYNRWGGEELYASSRVLDGLLRRLYPRMDILFVHGERSRRMYEEEFPPTRMLVEIPHGDERLFGDEPPPPAAEPRALFFGDWRKVKGMEVLMAAFDRLLARRPEARLTIAGTPSPIDGDPEAVRRWGTERAGSVEIVDAYVPMEEVPALFARARVVVCPYLAAAQSGVVHLAMTMGRAVIASDVGDLPDSVLDGRTGRLVPVADAERLAEALEEALFTDELAARWGAAGREHVMAGVGWETVAERVEEALRRSLADRG